MARIPVPTLSIIRGFYKRDGLGAFRATHQGVCAFCKHEQTGRPGRRLLSSARQQQQRQQHATLSQTPRNEAAKPRTHYEMFPESLPRGAPPAGAFAIDLRQLRREFLRLQGAAHPDRHSGELRSRAEATSTYINEAYRTLQDPLLRAQYLLSLRGIDVADDETATVEDPELLMQVLETRETIEEAQAEEDLEPLRRENDARIAASLSVLEKAFEADDLPAAKSEAVKLRYWVNIRDSVQNWEKGKPVVLIH